MLSKPVFIYLLNSSIGNTNVNSSDFVISLSNNSIENIAPAMSKLELTILTNSSNLELVAKTTEAIFSSIF